MIITDFEPKEDDQQVFGWYKSLRKEVSEIDEKLDAGSEAAGKRKFTNNLIDNNEGVWKPVVDHISSQMVSMPEDVKAAAFYGVIRNLTSSFKEEIDKWVQTQFEAQPKDTSVVLSDEQKKELMTMRSEMTKQLKVLVEMAINFNQCPTDDPWDLPPRRGATGKRGKRALSLYSWTIDGVSVAEDNNSVKGVSEILGYEKVADFTKALRDAGIVTKSPEPTFTLQLLGKEVTASKTEEDFVDDDDDDDDEDEVEE